MISRPLNVSEFVLKNEQPGLEQSA